MVDFPIDELIKMKFKELTSHDIDNKLKEIVQAAVLGNTYCVITPEGEALGGNISERALIKFLDKLYHMFNYLVN